MYAPVILFTYSRLQHTRQTIDSLLTNDLAGDTDLIVFSDGPRTQEVAHAVQEVRDYLSAINGFRSVTIHLRPTNFGLSKSIISGVTQILAKHDQVIVLEDDMITSRHFLSYMNAALNRYADEERVISIHGYTYPVKEKLPEAFFIQGADCWGWATWRRGWALFNPDGQTLLYEIQSRKQIQAFDLDGAYPYSEMLKAQIRGENDSWAIRWHASAFLETKLTLYPGRSLVRNIGHDNSGTHCSSSTWLDVDLSKTPINLDHVPVNASLTATNAFADFLRKGIPLHRRLAKKILPNSLRRKINSIQKLLS